MVNDEIGGESVLITFCPLCYSAIVFSRKVEDATLSFGVSGFLRHSDMVMYDRATESRWDITGNTFIAINKTAITSAIFLYLRISHT